MALFRRLLSRRARAAGASGGGRGGGGAARGAPAAGYPFPSPELAIPVDARPARPAVRVYNDRDGLPQNGVASVAFDARGSLWAGTEDGAAVYDGRVWRAVDMPNRTRSNWVRTMLATTDGSLWFGTRGGGLARLEDGGWRVYDTASGLPNNQIHALVETRGADGRPVLWVGTEGGLARFD